ncbi:MAG: nuclear transport factor 2 family protein [Pseudolabrys sp.]
MSGPVRRAVVEAFYDALSNRDMVTLATFLDDDVVWTISGPVDILPFCGRRVGKDVVMDLLVREVPPFCQDGASLRRQCWWTAIAPRCSAN